MMADIVKQDTGKRGKPNIPAAEWKMIRTLLGYSVGYNISYKCRARCFILAVSESLSVPCLAQNALLLVHVRCYWYI